MVSLKKSLHTLMLAGGLLASGGVLKAQEITKRYKDSVSHVLHTQQRQSSVLMSLKQRAIFDKVTEVSYVFDNIPSDLEVIGVASRNGIRFAEPGKLIVGGGNNILFTLQTLGFNPVEVANGVYEINVSGDIVQQREKISKALGNAHVLYKAYGYTSICPTFNDPEQLINGRQAWLTDVQWAAANISNPKSHDLDSVYSKKVMHVTSTTANPNIVVNIFDGGFDVNNAEFVNRVIRRWNHTNNTINTTATNHGSSVASLSSATSNNNFGGAGMYDGPIRLYQISADGISFPVTNLYVALDSLIQHCLQFPNQRQINNFSFSAGNDPLVLSRIQQLFAMNSQKQNFFQAATGNAGAASLDWPARWVECTAWGATNITNAKPIWASSNTGPEMIIKGYVSDGQGVWAMQANGTFAAINGTSFSTPIGTGTVAVIVSQDLSRDNTQVRAVLDDGARDLGAVGPDQIYGKGWVELDRGLKIQAVKHMPNSFDAAVTPSYSFIPKYYNGLQTTNEKVYVNGSPTGIIPTINGQNEAVFALNYITANGFANGTNIIRYEFNTPDGCTTSIYKSFTLSNVSNPTPPPVPTIINVDPIECQSNPVQTGKLMNPPVVPATIAVTQDGNPLTYNPVDSTFSYPVGTPGAHNIRAIYTNTAGSSQKDTAYNVTAAITPAAALPSVNNANICTGQSATFTANATNVGGTPTYKWYINNVEQVGFTANTFTPPVFNTVGTYQIKYEVTPTVGGCYTSSVPVTSGNTALNVAQTANPTGDVGPNAVVICENTAGSLTFAFTNNNGVIYIHEQRIINPGLVDNTNGNVVPGAISTPILTPGIWKSYVKSTRQGGNICAPLTVYSDTATITVNTQFIADAAITGPGQACDNAAISGLVTPIPGTPNGSVFKMYKQVGAGSPTLFQTTTYSGAPFNYNTTAQVPLTKVWSVIELPVGACYVNANGDTASVNVDVNITPATTAPSATSTAICSGQNVTMLANYTNMGATPSFQWYRNGTLIPGATGSSYNYINAATGTQGFHVVVTPTPGGCYTNPNPVTSPVTNVVVSQTANPIGDVGPNAIAQCENTAANLTFTFVGNNGVVYTHEHHLINPSNVDNTIGLITPGTYITPILGPGSWKSYIKSIRQGANGCALPTVYSDTATITISAQFIADAAITGPGQACDNAAISGLVTPIPGTPNGSIFKMYKQVGAGAPTLFQTTTYSGAAFNYNTTAQIPLTKVWSVIELPVGACYVNANGDTATINVNATPSAPIDNVVHPTCTVSTGSITVTNGQAGDEFSFNNGATWQTSNVATGLAAGTYQVLRRNTSGCISSATAEVINAQPATPSAPIDNVVQPTCTVSTGSITVTNGQAGDQFSFNNGATWQTSNVATGLAAGTYQVLRRNTFGCISSATAEVINAQPATPSAPVATLVQPTCTVSTGSITVTNGQAGDQFSFNNGATWQTSNVATGLAAGTYQVLRRNTSGCISSATAEVINAQPPTPSAPIDNVVHPTCTVSTGSITVTNGQAGDQFSFNNGATWQTSNIATGLAAGTYQVLRRNTFGCISSATAEVINAQPATPSAPVATLVQPTCAVSTGSITVTNGQAGDEFSFNNGTTWQTSNIATGLAAGTYQVLRRNTSGCISSATAQVINAQPATPSAPVATLIQPTCAVSTGSITVTNGQAGDEFSFNNGLNWQTSPTATGLAAGTYQVLRRNTSGCISTATAQVINAQPATPSAPVGNVVQPTCIVSTGSITVTNGQAGDQYSFNNGTTWQTSNVATGLAAGTYQVLRRNTAGCISSATAQVINAQPATPSAPIDNVVHPTCTVSTGSITVTNGQAGDQYSFNNGTTWQTSNVATGLAAGTYQVLRRNTAGCISSATAEVINSAPTVPVVGAITQVGNILSVPSIVGATYQWQFSTTATGPFASIAGAFTTSHTMTQSGYYKLVATSANSCVGSSSVFNGIITSVTPTLNNGKLKFFPNPLQNGQTLTIDSLPQGATKVKIGIYDAKGATVRLMEAQVSNRRVQLQLPFLASGLYFIRVQDTRNGKRYEGGEKIIVN